MKNFKLILICLIIPILLSSCCLDNSHPSETYQEGEYKQFSTMLNHCEGTTIVIGVSPMEGKVKHASTYIIVRDSKNITYTCAIGGDLGLHKGDTVKY